MVADTLPDDLLTITECAERANVPVRTMRRWLVAAHEKHGGILVSFQRDGQKVRKWWVHPLGLKLLRKGQTTEEQIGELEERIGELEEMIRENGRRIEGLKDAHVAHKRELAKWQRKMERRVAHLKKTQEDLVAMAADWDRDD